MRALDDYAAALAAQGYRPATIRAKVGAVALAAAHAHVDPHELTAADVLAWLGSCPRAAWTRRKYVTHLRAWCAYVGIPDATAGVRVPRAPAGVPKPVSQVDLDRLLEVATGRDRVWVLLGAYCGLRAAESASVAGRDVEPMADGTVLLRVRGKGGTVALVPVPPVVLVELERLRAAHGAARFWPRATGATVTAAVARLAARAGVSCTSHQLRHRYGSAVYASTRDLLLTKRLMRHASMATTEGYVATARDHDAAVVSGLPGATGDAAPARPVLRLVR